MILLFVNKQRRRSPEELVKIKALCEEAMNLCLNRPFVDRRLRKANLVLSATINFVGDDFMRRTNKEYRGIDSTTDVLTFPLLSMENGKLLDPLTDADLVPHRDGLTEIPLGEVLLSLDKAQNQADEYGHSFEREVAFLVTHAAMHLLGFDHVDKESEKAMVLEQERVLRTMGLSRKASAKENTPSDSISSQKDVSTVPSGSVEEDLLHSGFCAIIGRPNAGKSTLLNTMSGMKLAIVSHKPQTTRKNIRSVINRDDTQIVFVDTPGLHRPNSKLDEYMVDNAFRAAGDADVVLLLTDASKGMPSPIERRACEQAAASRKPVILALNKVDTVEKESLLPLIARYHSLFNFAAILPISARTGDGVEELIREISSHLPKGPRLFPEEEMTDQSERALAAEFIREQILHYTNQEIPHGTAVDIERFEERLKEDSKDEYDRDLVKITASIICERQSHRAILLGHGGQMIKRIGTAARINIERMCGCKVFLDLHIKVRADWKNTPVQLTGLGYVRED